MSTKRSYKSNHETSSAHQHSEKALQILKSTQLLIQQNGYNGFSFRDVAEKVGIKSASIHYHFPTKSGLVKAATVDYKQSFDVLLETIEGEVTTAHGRLTRYGQLFERSLEEHSICLCGMLASDSATLPDDVRPEVARFFAAQTLWLTQVIKHGQKKGELRDDLNAKQLAFTFLSTLEGAIILAQNLSEPIKLKQSSRQFIAMCKAN